ncbi:helix-turn-helix transcriptional regulator [Paludibaculum fermentans]|uniref:Helix-turn-helix transcriptional regulator n=1 Tax=Paludibaculum fermentans TaxID=1473598 RepID=A0A7S7NV73_PALFE|nr:helix-turn-helix transcriptional regulator [Paludibaculum fermentans]QOY90364.1 helix-turn-helix transcriptional regulator [Paludibaculum fermentans]
MELMAQTNDSLRGSLDRLILRTLLPGDLHGYGIVQFIQQSCGHELLVEEGWLYPALQRLELNGWIDGVWRMAGKNRRTRIYSLTAAGREQVALETGQNAEVACGRTLAKRSAYFAIVCTSLAVSGQPARYDVFDPKRDCDPMPPLIRDAAKDAGIPLHLVCFISDRSRFGLKAGAAWAAGLDRAGDLVRVVLPFGNLLVVNGTEPAVQMAVRCYDAEKQKRLNAVRFAGEQNRSANMIVLERTTEGIRALRKSYAALLAPYHPLVTPNGPRSQPPAGQ